MKTITKILILLISLNIINTKAEGARITDMDLLKLSLSLWSYYMIYDSSLNIEKSKNLIDLGSKLASCESEEISGLLCHFKSSHGTDIKRTKEDPSKLPSLVKSISKTTIDNATSDLNYYHFIRMLGAIFFLISR